MDSTAGADVAGAVTRVLLVDNEVGMLEVFSDALERLGAMSIVAEQSSRRAAELLRVQPFDLLVTDVQMPELSGLALLRLARERAPAMPVLVVTGYPSPESAARCRTLGAAGYLTKPFVPEAFQEAVRKALAGRGGEHAPD